MRRVSVMAAQLPPSPSQNTLRAIFAAAGFPLDRVFGYGPAPMDGTQTRDATLDVADVRAAAERIAGAVVRTPTMHSKTLSKMTGAEIWLKFENQQFTAAYKERGALNALLLMDPEQRKRGV